MSKKKKPPSGGVGRGGAVEREAEREVTCVVEAEVAGELGGGELREGRGGSERGKERQCEDACGPGHHDRRCWAEKEKERRGRGSNGRGAYK